MKKTLSCIASFLPIIGVILSVTGIIVWAIWAGEELSTIENVVAILLLVFTFATVIFAFVLNVWYIIKTWKNAYLSAGMKILWTALLYCCNIFVFPIFWFMYVRHEYDGY